MSNEELVSLIKNGEDYEKHLMELYERNKPFIYGVVKKYTGQVEIEDLMQEAFISLMNAVKCFDDFYGCSFITYLRFWIKQGSIGLVYRDNHLSMNKEMAALVKNYKHFADRMMMQFGRMPTDREIQCQFDISQKQLDNLKMNVYRSKVSYFDAIISGESDEDFTLADCVADKTNPMDAVLDEIEAEQLRDVMKEAIKELPDIESKVIEKIYYENKTLKECAEELNLSTESIRQKRNSSLRKIRNGKCKDALEQFAEFQQVQYAKAYHAGHTNFERYGSTVEYIALLIADYEKEHNLCSNQN